MKGFPHRLNAITLGPAKSFSLSGRQRVRTQSTSCSVTFSSYVNSLPPGFSEKPLSHHCPEEKHPCWLPRRKAARQPLRLDICSSLSFAMLSSQCLTMPQTHSIFNYLGHSNGLLHKHTRDSSSSAPLTVLCLLHLPGREAECGFLFAPDRVVFTVRRTS